MSSENCTEIFPKDFERATEILPFTKYGISTIEEFQSEESRLQNIEWLKKAGLSNEEIKLYHNHKNGLADPQKKLEKSVLRSRLEVIYDKINKYKHSTKESSKSEEQPSTSNTNKLDTIHKPQNIPLKFYPPDHPINDIKEIEESLFGHLKDQEPILPINKRRKILRRLERRKERILNQTFDPLISTSSQSTCERRPGSLWDVREAPQKDSLQKTTDKTESKNKLIGPKKQTMYTIKDGKIVRLEPLPNKDSEQNQYEAKDIVIPTNKAEEKLLEGSKICVDDIRKMERFKEYTPGVPSKVLYAKNIAPSVTQERLSALFDRFVPENGGPVPVTLMAGRMRGQAFVSFCTQQLAMRALDEVNGTILGGRPIIVQFGRQSNHIQDNT